LVQKDANNDITFKLSDYGLNSLLISKETKSELICWPRYVPPEFFLDNKDESKVDYWQIGIIAYFLSTGNFPFEGKDLDIAIQIKYKDIEIPDFIQGEQRDFIEEILTKDVEIRLGDGKAFEHPWIRKSNIQKVTEVEVTDQLQEDALKKICSFATGNAISKKISYFLMNRATYSDKQAEFIKLFKEMDENDDGLIDKEELFARYGAKFPTEEKNAKARLKDMIYQADIDNDGKLNINEFMFITNQEQQKVDDEQLKELWLLFDGNNSGFIDKKDLKIALNDQKMSNADLERMIEEFDQDDDGKLSFDEFKYLVTKTKD